MATITDSGFFTGTGARDILTGDGEGKTSDQIFGRGGNDLIRGKAKKDELFGEDGNDRLFGGGGKDTLDGGANDDDLFGQGGSDKLFGGAGKDFLNGGGGSDTLDGGDGDDQLLGGGKDDVLIGSSDDDILDGGKGTDIADYSGLNEAITLEAVGVVNKGSNGTDLIENIEHIIGAAGLDNSIDGSTGTSTATSFDVNLEKEELTVKGIPGGDVDFSIENFVNVIGTSQDDKIKGDSADNTLEGGEGSDLFLGSGGNDVIAGNDVAGNEDNADDTVKYKGFGITLEATGTVIKDGVGTDQLVRVETIQGDKNKTNTIDASTAAAGASIDVDLGDKSLEINTGGPILDRTVINFKDVIGTDGNDTIVDSDLDNDLHGGKGNDTITTSLGNDTVSGGKGSDTINADFGQDVLTGGTGGDLFVLGGNGEVSFNDDGSNDFATITDFGDGNDKVQLLGIANVPNSYTFSGGPTQTFIFDSGDLIAVVQGAFDENTDIVFSL